MHIAGVTRKRSRFHARGAFTLIELLVVIAIIAILAGLLMAALRAIRGYRVGTMPQMPWRVMGPKAIGFISGEFVLVGGQGSGREVLIYDPARQAWDRGTDYPRTDGRFGQGYAVFDDKPYLFGGYNRSGNYVTDTVDVYNPIRDSWQLDISKCPSPIAHPACITIGERIYMIGGTQYSGALFDNVWAFYPRENRWEALAPLPHALVDHAVVSPDARFRELAGAGRGTHLYVIGGSRGGGIPRPEIYRYDVHENRWSSAGELNIGLATSKTGVICNGRYAFIYGQGFPDRSRKGIVKVDLKSGSGGLVVTFPRDPNSNDAPGAIGGLGSTLYVFGRDPQAYSEKIGLPAGYVCYQRP